MTAGYTGSEQRNRNSDWADFKTYDPEHSGFRILKRPISRSAPDWRFGPQTDLDWSGAQAAVLRIRTTWGVTVNGASAKPLASSPESRRLTALLGLTHPSEAHGAGKCDSRSPEAIAARLRSTLRRERASEPLLRALAHSGRRRGQNG